ncbi:hypothetical protein OUZ56_005194 [Daphnia magna]|uniref:Uncharacterized protein n=1 Tax=Daphnia magna TaxID=35525 RepID=A0ABQ9YS33_9CRUS|nr:hypothetical protein OUZ56_005194 [Daphnia magna]
MCRVERAKDWGESGSRLGGGNIGQPSVRIWVRTKRANNVTELKLTDPTPTPFSCHQLAVTTPHLRRLLT